MNRGESSSKKKKKNVTELVIKPELTLEFCKSELVMTFLLLNR